jgi:hypothetical protein
LPLGFCCHSMLYAATCFMLPHDKFSRSMLYVAICFM